MKKLITCVLSISMLSAPGLAQQRTDLLKKVKEFSETPLLKNAQWSLCATYVDELEPIIAWNTQFALAPGSCLKLVTTAAALDILGEEYTFETKLCSDGEISSDGVLRGNLHLVGGGDPTLGSTLCPGSLGLKDLMTSWIGALRAKGITAIDGSVIADDLIFDRVPIPGNWFWIDIGNYYAMSTSGLSIHDNLYWLYFRPAAEVGGKAELLRVDPEIPGLSFENFMRTGPEGSGDNGYVYCAPRQYNAVLRGTIPMGQSEFGIKGSIPDPPLFAAQYFTGALKEAGIPVTGAASLVKKPRGEVPEAVLAVTTSPSLKDICRIINKRSFNLYAEQVLKAIGLREGGEGSIEKGTEAVERFLARLGVNTDGLQLIDGSGLSRINCITTRSIVEMLAAMTRSKHFDAFYGSMSVAADTNDIGFFKTFGTNTELAMNLRIKDGVIQAARSYSGYLHDRSGRLIAFSFIANNYTPGKVSIGNVHREILLELARLE